MRAQASLVNTVARAFRQNHQMALSAGAWGEGRALVVKEVLISLDAQMISFSLILQTINEN